MEAKHGTDFVSNDETQPRLLPRSGFFYFRHMTWDEQLLTIEWDKKRTEILIRDNFTCQIPGCLRKASLHVHHRLYLGIKAWEYPNDLLVTLCDSHHKQYHDNVEELEQKLCDTLKMKGFMLAELLALNTHLHNDQFAQSLLKVLRDVQNG